MNIQAFWAGVTVGFGITIGFGLSMLGWLIWKNLWERIGRELRKGARRPPPSSP